MTKPAVRTCFRERRAKPGGEPARPACVRSRAFFRRLPRRARNDFRSRRPDLVALVSITELERLLMVAAQPPATLSERLRGRFRKVMFEEAERIAGIMEEPPP